MKYLAMLSVFFVFWAKFNRIAEMNELKERAAEYYRKEEYIKCIGLYERLYNEYRETDESVRLNLANCYFQLKRYNNAVDNYKLLINSKDPLLQSCAYLQLGVIYGSNNKKELGLSYFKEALKANPGNEQARYNFELLKKVVDKSQKENSTDKKRENSEGKNKTTSSTSEEIQKSNTGSIDKPKGNTNSQDGTNEEDDSTLGGEEEEEETEFNENGTNESEALLSKRLAEMDMNERQARMILKTMRSNEIQYFQQRKKTSISKKNSGQPDW